MIQRQPSSQPLIEDPSAAADVFVSYASEDRESAARLATSLAALGWSVWWDRNILAGQAFDQAIERALESAKSVVVLWSRHSIVSEWVKNEAAAAAERGVLVPATIESIKLPLEFRRKQTADLTDWRGETSHAGFRHLCEGVAAMIGRAPRKLPDAAQTKRSLFYPVVILAAIVVIAILGVYAFSTFGTVSPAALPGQEGAAESKGVGPPAAGLADLAVGDYFGDVIADSKGGSLSDIGLTISKLGNRKVRVTSDYERIGTIDVELTRIDKTIMNAGGDTTFALDLDQTPPALSLDPRGELAFRGTRR